MENLQSAKHDITTKEDIVLMVDTFYEKVRNNETLGFVFNDVAQVDWPNHLPKMYSFWGSMLLGERTYTGNPMVRHVELSKLTPMAETQFTAWIVLFMATVDELFAGEKANEAKERASSVAGFMMHKIQEGK